MAKKTDKATSAAGVHLMRHGLHKLGKTVEEIAAEQNVSERVIRRSIAIVDMYRLNNTPEVLNAGMIDSILGRKKKLDTALDNGLSATILGREGTRIPDHKTQLQAVDKVIKLVKEMQPKPASGRNLNVNVNQQTGVHQAVVSTETPFTGFEERLRSVRAKIDQRNQLPPPESVAAPLGEDELDLDNEEEVESVGPEHPPGERVSE